MGRDFLDLRLDDLWGFGPCGLEKGALGGKIGRPVAGQASRIRCHARSDRVCHACAFQLWLTGSSYARVSLKFGLIRRGQQRARLGQVQRPGMLGQDHAV